MAPDDHILPRLLVCMAGALTAGATGALALVLLTMTRSHSTGGVFLGFAVFAAFTAVAELLTVASLATDRRMVSWFVWCVAPGVFAGMAIGGYGLREAGMDLVVASVTSAVFGAGAVYAMRRFSLGLFESSERKRRPGVCSRCGYALGEMARCPECGARAG